MRNTTHSSILRSALVKFFRSHPDITLHQIMQWCYGACTVKPLSQLDFWHFDYLISFVISKPIRCLKHAGLKLTRWV